MAVIFDPLISSIKIIDASIPATEAQPTALDTSLSAVFPVFCSKGRDNVITENKSTSVISSRYGDDFSSFTKWGQANIAAIGITRSMGRAFICRLLPDDAKRSYVVFGVHIKERKESDGIIQYKRTDTEMSEDGTSVIYFGTGSYELNKDQDGNLVKVPIKVKTGAVDPDTQEPVYEEVKLAGVEIRVGTLPDGVLSEEHFDSEGYPSLYPHEIGEVGVAGEDFYPLFAFSYYGRGEGGNSFGFNIVRDAGRDKALQDGRRYYMTCYERLSSGALSALYPEPFYFSFNPTAKFSPDSNIQEGLSAVYVNTDDKGDDNPLQIFVYDENYLKLVNFLSTYKDASETIYDIDFINCLFKNGNPYGKIVKSADSDDVTNGIVTLKKGNDGSLDPEIVANNPEITISEADIPAYIVQQKNDLISKFFRYEVDETLLDEKICDIDIAPDCNYVPAVKKTMLRDFHTYRPDIKLVMDVGITKSYREAMNNWTDYIPFINTEYSYMVSVNGHSGTLSDPAIGSPYPITYTYDYLRSLADNFATSNGAFQMHAGSTRGRVKYFKPYWIAQKSLNNMYEALEELGLNYIERIDKNKNLMYGNESTQYMVGGLSKLTSDRNSLVVGRAIRICHGVLINYKYDERNIEDTMSAAQMNMNRELQRSNIPSSIGITTVVYQTKEDKRTDNAHCDIAFSFPDFAKKFHVTIYALRPNSALPPSIANNITV
ncbi:MAG: hypothetical protein LBT43_13860 [Prevotella sp.]|jgi:hypothetical protein|nr:hypothetical protein [Prevotella sp.]